MTWILLGSIAMVLALALAAAWHRRADLRRQADALAERRDAAQRPATAPPLQVPVIDLERCLGCGTCVKACPEDGVLQLVHGQAAVVQASACVGHAHCVAECPVGAVTLATGDLSQRRDVPVLDDHLEAPTMPGVFLVGEVTARALIRSAINQGRQVGEHVAARCLVPSGASADDTVLDAVVVGAGPGGLACALALRAAGVRFVLLDQEQAIGGTVAKYPRRKMVLTEPVELPLYGRMRERQYGKEELIELWRGIAERHELPFTGGVAFEQVERQADGTLQVHTSAGSHRTRHLVLAVGRRGTPRRLGVPGEDLPHVAFSLLDAASYQGRTIVVVGGGDSAIEAALALAEQSGNRVTLVHRQAEFTRLRRRNRDRLAAQLASGGLQAVRSAEVAAITAGKVVVRTGVGAQELPADDVFVMIGGEPPFALLERSGVSFDHRRDATPTPTTTPAEPPRANSLVPALAAALLLTLVAGGFVLWHLDYYGLPNVERAGDPKHVWLSPGRGLGLWLGIAAAAAMLLNLAYLARRQQWRGFGWGSLPTWLSVHVATGVLAFVVAALHAAMAPRETPGGYAFWGLAALLLTGAIGRWFYAWLPRAANGREVEIDRLRAELQARRTDPHASSFARSAATTIDELVERRQWRSTWLGRVVALLGLQFDLWLTLRRLRQSARAAGVPPAEAAAVAADLRQAHAAAVAAAHLEDLRALLGSWRWLHRWVALLVVVLVVIHVVVAALHGAFTGGSR